MNTDAAQWLQDTMRRETPRRMAWTDAPLVFDDAAAAALGEESGSGADGLFPVQRAVLSVLRDYPHSDVCVWAPTGSGKTLAYVLPVAADVRASPRDRLRALVVVPNRELAAQVAGVFARHAPDVRVAATDGASFCADALAKSGAHVDVLVATPGRLLDAIDAAVLPLAHVAWLVLDESDRLLDAQPEAWLRPAVAAVDSRPGLHSSWDAALGWETRAKRVLLSATPTRNPAKLVELRLRHPLLVHVTARISKCGVDGAHPEKEGHPETDTLPDAEGPAARYALPPGLAHVMVTCRTAGEDARVAAALHLITAELASGGGLLRCVVFVRAVDTCVRLAALLSAAVGPEREKQVAPFCVGAGHAAPLAQTLAAFCAGDVRVLVATDAAARGLDVPSVPAVLCFDAPRHPRTLVHRAGRTARAGDPGTLYVLLEPQHVRPYRDMVAAAFGGQHRPSVLRPRLDKALAAVRRAASALSPGGN